MSSTEAKGAALILPRRNFLVRALGLTVAGATVTIPIITQDDALKRIEHHRSGLEAAMRDYYAGLKVEVCGNGHTPEHVLKGGYPACMVFTATRSGT
jgi:hypothetical protein